MGVNGSDTQRRHYSTLFLENSEHCHKSRVREWEIMQHQDSQSDTS